MVRDLLLVAAVLGIFWVGYALRAVTVPLLVALLLAYLFEPLIDRLSRHAKIKRPTAVLGLLATVGVLVAVLLALALPLFYGQARRLIDDVVGGEMRRRVTALRPLVPAKLGEEFEMVVDLFPAGEPARQGPAPADEPAPPPPPDDASPTWAETRALVDERIAAEMDRLRAGVAPGQPAAGGELRSLVEEARAGARTVFSILGAVVGFGLLLFLIPFYFFFFSVWYPLVVRFGRDLLPHKNRKRALELLGKMDGVIAGFVRGRIVISLIMGVMLAIGWMICGVPYAVILGIVVGIFCAVPYLGAIGIPLAVGFLLFEQLPDHLPAATAAAAAAAENGGIPWWVWTVVWPTLVFVIVQVFEGYVLTPMIAGKATNLDPVTILVAVLAGGSVLGIYGMLLAIPMAACGKILCTEVLLPKIRAWTRGEAADPLPLGE